MRHVQWLFVVMLAAAPLYAQVDAGDAPAPYPVTDFVSFQGPRLGLLCGADAVNPVVPAWTGDDDDGIVGAPPVWTAGSTGNTLSLDVTIKGYGDEYLVVWVDADDDGQWTQAERYIYGNGELTASGVCTFNNITLPTRNFVLNGADKVAVRVMSFYAWFGGVPADPGSALYCEGEIEDWLLDVNPVGFSVSTDGPLPDAREGDYYGQWFDAINGVPSYTWALAGGSLPSGLSLSTQNDQGLLDGTPVPGSSALGGVTYVFDIRVTDSTGATTTRSYSLFVRPLPPLAPFRDNFSTYLGWKLDTEWSRGQASGASFSVGALTVREPSIDATPNSSDNMVLADSSGGPYTQLNASKWATSPEIDCSNLSSVILRFKRFLSIDLWSYDKARVQICNDGVNWVNVWTSQVGPGAGSAIIDADWASQEFDISAMAAGQRLVQIRFGIGTTDLQTNYAGWCIDDFEILPKPSNTALTGVGMTVQTPALIGGIPACYKGSCYTFKTMVDNHAVETMSLDFATVSLTVLGASTPHEAGTFTLPVPITIPPSASAYAVMGVFNCTALPPPGAGQYLMTVRFFGSGSNGTWVECTVARLVEIHNGPGGPGHLEVYEGGQFLLNPAPAIGGRDFGTRDINLGPSPALNISVRNTGIAPVSVAAPVLSNSADFTLDLSQWPGALNGNSTANIAVYFNPSVVGPCTCVLSFTHSATFSTDTPFVIALKGTGVDNVAAIEVRENDAAGLVIAYGSAATGGRDFGAWDVNAGASATLTIHIANVGAQSLTLPGWPSLTGADAADFGIDFTGIVRRLNPGMSTTLRIWFDPMTVGAKTAKVSINHTGLNEPMPFEFDIGGMAVLITPILVVRELTPTGAVVMPGSVAVGSARDFGNRNIFAGPSTTLGIFVCNAGNADLVISQPALIGDSGEFVLTATQAVIVPGDWMMLMMVFDPASVGAKSAWVEINHNAGPMFRCEVAGLGEFPQPLGFLTPSLLPGVEVHGSYGPIWIQAQGGTSPYSYVLGGALPTGFVFNDAGRIIGAAECAPGIYQFDVTVTDAMGDFVSQNFAIEVTPTVTAEPPPGNLVGDSSAPVGCAAGETNWTWGWLLPLLWVATRRRVRVRAPFRRLWRKGA
ncbi:MAG: choice-of-anchor D domain-containing protein [Planctomycetes bacterium]|nr:choice-of-anchor D domain-containing protein [Planctomycetota bacterium]